MLLQSSVGSSVGLEKYKKIEDFSFYLSDTRRDGRIKEVAMVRPSIPLLQSKSLYCVVKRSDLIAMKERDKKFIK